MADKPAEKISISFKGDKKASPPISPAPAHKRRIEPLTGDESTHAAPADIEEAQPTAEAEAKGESLLDEDISNSVEERPASGGLDGGFAEDMKEESAASEDRSARHEVEAPEKKASSDFAKTEELTETDDEDTVYSGDEEFYSSKLDPKHTENRSNHQEKVKKTKSPAPRMSLQYILVLATFVTVSIVGLFILNELEEAREGAGIIFDWLP